MKETLMAETARLGLELTSEQGAQLCAFGEALIEKNKVMNLTAITEPQAVAKLHFADCLALLKMTDFHGKTVIDVGCGAGFPGVPLKIGEPSMKLTLLDSLQKRITWLTELLPTLGVEAKCVAARAEEYGYREQFDIATSRAVARLPILAELCLPFVKVGGCFLAMKAAAAREELEEAKRAIAVLGGKLERVVEYEIDGAERCVLLIRKCKPTPPQYPRRFAKIKQNPL
jgi:16S rRNA (guanine527-N7)-methyltransferase